MAGETPTDLSAIRNEVFIPTMEALEKAFRLLESQVACPNTEALEGRLCLPLC